VPAFSVPKVVLFDLDDTLFDHASAARAALRGVHGAHHGLASRDFAAFERDHAQHLEDLHVRVVAGEIGIDEARIERFRRLLAQSGVSADDDLLARIAAGYRRSYLDARAPIDGARDLLAALEGRVKIGVVSNNLLEEQREKMRHCGLDAYVDALIVSEEAGVSKPDPAIFAIALERVGAAAGDAVMIGDSWAADIQGAIAAGVRAIWFNRFNRPLPRADVASFDAFVPIQPVLDLIFGRDRTTPSRGHDEIECSA
jgi:putative hydrolase of the HAD superfamily